MMGAWQCQIMLHQLKICQIQEIQEWTHGGMDGGGMDDGGFDFDIGF